MRAEALGRAVVAESAAAAPLLSSAMRMRMLAICELCAMCCDYTTLRAKLTFALRRSLGEPLEDHAEAYDRRAVRVVVRLTGFFLLVLLGIIASQSH